MKGGSLIGDIGPGLDKAGKILDDAVAGADDGELYVESLSDAKGPAPTYEKMFRYNVDQLAAAMAKSS